MSFSQEESGQASAFDYANNEHLNVFDNEQDHPRSSILSEAFDAGITSSQFTSCSGDIPQCTSPTKRRKIDKDGFVTPATPDIPKTSCHYGISRSKDLDLEDGDDLKISASQPVETENLILEETTGDKDLIKYDDKEWENISVEDIIKNMGQETKMLNLKWSSILGESASYEMFCPSRLDKLIEQAKELESNLKQQKDLLHRRLRVISETLKMI